MINLILDLLLGRPKYWIMRQNNDKTIITIVSRVIPESELIFTSMGGIVIDGPISVAEEAFDKVKLWANHYNEQRLQENS